MSSHNAVITRNSPSAFVYLLDISGSMSDTIMYEGEQMTKNDALNKIVNTTLHETILRCRNYDCHNDYFDIAILGYQNDTITNLLEPFTGKEGFCSISDIVCAEIGAKTYNYIRTKEDGTKFISQRNITQYIDTEPSGTTPMYKALESAYALLKRWTIEHKGRKCFPPVLINITDGEMSDANISEMLIISQKIKRLSTENGTVLFFNIHLSGDASVMPTIFPNNMNDLPDIRNIRLMFEMSSDLPDSFKEEITEHITNRSMDSLHNAKTMCYNTPINSLTRILEIGSSSKSFIK